jgi:Plexin repeat
MWFIWLCIFISLGILTFLYYNGGMREGFAYNENPCKSHGDCRSCADAPGCGWCPDLGVCQPMAQDGFPIRTKDLTSGDPNVSPYLVEGVIPVISDCPPHCKTTDLGDCVCSKWDYTNSCAPECHVIYGKGCVCPSDTSGSGSDSAVYLEGSSGQKSLTDLELVMIDKRNRATVTLHGEEMEIVNKLATATTNMNKLLKSTRIHICSPHTFVIDSAKC